MSLFLWSTKKRWSVWWFRIQHGVEFCQLKPLTIWWCSLWRSRSNYCVWRRPKTAFVNQAKKRDADILMALERLRNEAHRHLLPYLLDLRISWIIPAALRRNVSPRATPHRRMGAQKEALFDREKEVPFLYFHSLVSFFFLILVFACFYFSLFYISILIFPLQFNEKK